MSDKARIFMLKYKSPEMAQIFKYQTSGFEAKKVHNNLFWKFPFLIQVHCTERFILIL